MGIGTNTEDGDAGEIKGLQEAVACGVWFTAKGRVIPKTVKFQDVEGVYHTLNNIHVITCEETFYCGIPTITYECDTIYYGVEILFHLLFYKERNLWKILWKNGREDERSCVEDIM